MFIRAVLKTRTGSGDIATEHLVQEVTIPHYHPPADILVWGSRFFKFDRMSDGNGMIDLNNHPIYIEVFAVFVAPIPGLDMNGYEAGNGL
jgi:hypothetical protein